MFKQFLKLLRSPNILYAVMGLHLLGVLITLISVENATNNLLPAIVAILNLIGAGFAYALATFLQRGDPNA
jgi:hypothetical protein